MHKYIHMHACIHAHTNTKEHNDKIIFVFVRWSESFIYVNYQQKKLHLLFRILIYILNLFTLPIIVLISITTILMCLINHIYYGSPILLLSFYCVTEEKFPFLM